MPILWAAVGRVSHQLGTWTRVEEEVEREGTQDLLMMTTDDCEIHVHENVLATMIRSTLLVKCEWKLKAVFGGGGGSGGSGGGRSVQPCALAGPVRGSLHISAGARARMLVASLAKLELLLANPFAPPLQLAHRNLPQRRDRGDHTGSSIINS